MVMLSMLTTVGSFDGWLPNQPATQSMDKYSNPINGQIQQPNQWTNTATQSVDKYSMMQGNGYIVLSSCYIHI